MHTITIPLKAVLDNASKVWGVGRPYFPVRVSERRKWSESAWPGEDLHKRMNFNPFEDTVNRIRVVLDEPFGLILGLKF